MVIIINYIRFHTGNPESVVHNNARMCCKRMKLFASGYRSNSRNDKYRICIFLWRNGHGKCHFHSVKHCFMNCGGKILSVPGLVERHNVVHICLVCRLIWMILQNTKSIRECKCSNGNQHQCCYQYPYY